MNLHSDLHPKYFYNLYFISYTSVFYAVLDGLMWIIYKL